MNNKLILGLIVIIAVIILVLLFVFPQKPSSNDSIIIGSIFPLTGNASDQGNLERKAVELAIDEVNSSGGINGKLVQYISEDSKGGNVEESISAYKRITALGKVSAIITWGSGVGIALTPLMNEDKVVQMGVATSSPKYATPNDFTFRVFPDSRIEGGFDANFVFNDLNIKEASVIFTQNDYGVGGKDAFVLTFSSLGGKILSTQAVESGAVDARTQLLKIKEQNPKIIFLIVYPKEGVSVLQQAKELGVDANFIATSAIQSTDLDNIAKESAEGLLVSFVPFDVDSNEPLIKSFRESYLKKFAEMPALYSSTAYDGAKVILNGLNSCKNSSDVECLKNSLFALKDYVGLSGPISFDTNGDAKLQMKIVQFIDGKLVNYN